MIDRPVTEDEVKAADERLAQAQRALLQAREALLAAENRVIDARVYRTQVLQAQRLFGSR